MLTENELDELLLTDNSPTKLLIDDNMHEDFEMSILKARSEDVPNKKFKH